MRELVAFGNPEVATSANLDSSAGLLRLPYSAEEIQGISRMVRGRSTLFLGAADLKSAFLAKADSAPILHASTHAFVDADIPENSRILFSPESSNGEPDYLFLRELYDLDLRGINLATLSACNTERGKLIRGEGVQAFSRALLYSGSRSALTTLWRVADQPTSELMKQFYYYALVKRQSKAEALRSAKLKLLRSQTELENPVHWAAFVLTGDGFGVLPSFVSWGTLIVSAIIAVIAIALGARFLLRVRRRVYRINRS
jgi:CHAT domain-containing protein